MPDLLDKYALYEEVQSNTVSRRARKCKVPAVMYSTTSGLDMYLPEVDEQFLEAVRAYTDLTLHSNRGNKYLSLHIAEWKEIGAHEEFVVPGTDTFATPEKFQRSLSKIFSDLGVELEFTNVHNLVKFKH